MKQRKTAAFGHNLEMSHKLWSSLSERETRCALIWNLLKKKKQWKHGRFFYFLVLINLLSQVPLHIFDSEIGIVSIFFTKLHLKHRERGPTGSIKPLILNTLLNFPRLYNLALLIDSFFFFWVIFFFCWWENMPLMLYLTGAARVFHLIPHLPQPMYKSQSEKQPCKLHA